MPYLTQLFSVLFFSLQNLLIFLLNWTATFFNGLAALSSGYRVNNIDFTIHTYSEVKRIMLSYQVEAEDDDESQHVIGDDEDLAA